MSEPTPLESIFFAALEKAPGERAAFVNEACAGDESLRRRLERMLAAQIDAGSFLESPPSAVSVTSGPTIQQTQERAGMQIGPYRLLEQIGEGGFGIVFMAEQAAPVRRKVALKILKPGMDTRQVVARFEAERQALALMDHANIARVFDGGATPSGRPYFVMELVRGVPITEFCDQNQLAPRQRLELFLPVCQAVQHAHQKGIIHRDLKPSNILVVMHDTTPVVKVIDFGVAKALGQQLTDKTLFTGFAQLVGTPLYMSPEQAGQSGLDIDTRSDIFSLGVLLYELLTGTTPFDGERFKKAGFDEILRIIREEEPPKPSTRLSELDTAPALQNGRQTPREQIGSRSVATTTLASVAAFRGTEPEKLTKLVRGELDWIVMKCLDKDRNRRYETANSLAMDVQRYLKDEPVEACPPSAWYRFRKFARRHKRGLLTAAVVALAVVLMAAGSGGLIWRANQDLHQALESERRGAYVERIALAEREWGVNNLSRMEQLLDDCPEDLRGWEWRYLKRLPYGTLPPLRHESPVYSVAFSPPDGQYLATATLDGTVRIWRAKTGVELRKWQAHDNNATCVMFSPDGKYLASGAWDGKVKVWDVQTVLQREAPAPLFELEHSSRTRVWSVAFSPDGQRLASAGGRSADEKGEVKVWDLNTRQALLSLSDFSDRPNCVRFSPDGRRLAVVSPEVMRLWDAQTGREQLTWRDPQKGFTGVAFSPDGRRLASVAGNLHVHPDEEVKVWDAHTGKESLSMRGHVGGLRAVDYSPDGRRLASTGLDQTVKLWDAVTGEPALTLRGHIDNVFCLAFSPDGHQIASGSLDKTVRIWDASPVEGELGPEYRTLRGHQGAVTDVAFHPDGHRLASAGADGTVRLWDFRSGNRLAALKGTPSPITLRLAFNPDGTRLAVCSRHDRLIRVWDVASAKEIGNFAGHNGDAALCVAFSPDGRHAASAGYDFTVRVWDATTGKVVQSLEGNTWVLWGVAFSPDGHHLAACSADSTVRVWDWTTGKALPVLEPPHAARCANVAFSRDGKLLASASWDRTIKVWDCATWKLEHDLSDPAGAVLCVAFGPDRRLAWGSTDGTVKVWDGPGTETHVLRGHTSWVQAVAFSPAASSPGDEWIASASLDGSVKIWQAPPAAKAPAPETGIRGNQQATRPEED
ncbi:MAG: protein kinase [Planctomycetaceae bacterium]|nr:protein kinase [Planctomycetaceae bacterium]